MSDAGRIVPAPTDASAGNVSADERIAFERLLADRSARIANAPGDQLEREIESTLREILQFLGFDRSSFGEFAPDGTMTILSSVAVEGVPPVPKGQFNIPLPWYLAQLRANRMVVLETILDKIPPEAVAEAEYVRKSGVRSNLAIPLRVGGKVIGAIAFAAFHKTRAWPEEMIARLKLVGEVIAQALARRRSDDALLAAMSEVQRLKEQLEHENVYLQEFAQAKPPQGLVSRSPLFKAVIDEIAHVAPTNATVLLLGETGSGKEVVAQAIHDASGRARRVMVRVNCAALPGTLIEAELFGREKGAYTGALARQAGRFEIADGSTIFLDEIGELPLELQPKLLRVLQSGEFERVGGTQTIKVDARVIAATNRDLSRAVAEGKFREDLFYRLNVFPIEIPPLRERREDIALLAWNFVQEFSKSMGKQIEKIAGDSLSIMHSYSWPGNVRELRNVIERAMILTRNSTLHVTLGRTVQPPGANSKPATLADAECAHIRQVLERCNWRVRGPGGAAALLGVKPTTLESRMKKHGLARAGRASDISE